MDHPLQFRGEWHPQVEDFGVLFRTERKMEHETEKWIGAASAMMQMLKQSVVV